MTPAATGHGSSPVGDLSFHSAEAEQGADEIEASQRSGSAGNSGAPASARTGPDGSSALGRRAVRAPAAPLSRHAERLRLLAQRFGWTVTVATSSGLLVASRRDRTLYGDERTLADAIEATSGKEH